MNRRQTAALVASIVLLALGVAAEELLGLAMEWAMLLREAEVYPPRAAEILQQVPASGLLFGAVIAAALLGLYLPLRIVPTLAAAPRPAAVCSPSSPRRPRLPCTRRRRHVPRRLRR